MKRAAIYARVSTEHQTQTSLETQIKTCKAFCEKQGWIIADIYQEKDSGGKTERAEFQKMIAKALDGAYDVIVVEKFDRFFRDDIEDRRYTRMLESKGILVVSALEGVDPTSATGKLLRWIISDINWFQREYMKEEQLRKTKEAALRGFWLGGHVPFGYKAVEVKDGERKRKVLAIDEEKAQIVRTIFQLYAEGFSVPSIARYLNEHGMLKNGKPWSNATLYDMIKNPIYLGDYVWNRKRRSTWNREEVVAAGKVPAIVTGELAEKVRERLKVPSRRITFHRHFWLLNGKILCGLCGQKMYGNPHPRRPVYRCDNDKHQYVGISKEYVENYVLTYLQMKLNEANLDEYVDEYLKIYKARVEIQSSRKNEIMKRLQEIETQERRLVEAIAQGIHLDGIYEKAQELTKVKRELMEKLQSVEIPLPSREEILEWFKQVKEILDSDEPEIQKEIVFKLVDEIVVYPKRIVIVKLASDSSVF